MMIELTIPKDGYSCEVEFVANNESLELTQGEDLVALTPTQALGSIRSSQEASSGPAYIQG